jgi:hypothetical protein
VIPPRWDDVFDWVDVEAEEAALGARIWLALARLDLDAGGLAAAKTGIDRASDLIRGRDRWFLADELLALEARFELLSGDARSAFRRLRRRVLGHRGPGSPESWALLAIAADRVGDAEIYRLAADRAAELGVDLGPLTRPAD